MSAVMLVLNAGGQSDTLTARKMFRGGSCLKKLNMLEALSPRVLGNFSGHANGQHSETGLTCLEIAVNENH